MKRYMKVLCACGCNEPIRLGKKYVRGHNRRKPTAIDTVCYLYAKKKSSVLEISRKLGYSVNRVKRCLRQRNIKLRNLHQAAILAAQRGKFYMQTKKGKKEHGKKMRGRSYNRIYSYNRSFFKSINKHSAYLLGYICADGCVSKEGKLMFVTKDKDLLEKINFTLQSNKPLKCKDGKYFKLEFRSHEIYDDLLRLGIVPKKPLRAYPVNLPRETYPDFIRGYFDGDGCFAYHVSYDIYKSMITSSNYKILKWINSVLPTQRGTIYKRTPACSELRYGFWDTLRLGNFIYKNLTPMDIYLPRKFALFQKIKKFANTKRFKKTNFLNKGDDTNDKRRCFSRRIGKEIIPAYSCYK